MKSALVTCAFVWSALVAAAALPSATGQAVPPGGEPVLRADALSASPVGGLERTRASAESVPVSGMPFSRALRVTIRASAPDSNVTQLTMPNMQPVAKGDVLLVSFYVRGAATGGGPAQVLFFFEKATDPWTKSGSLGVTTPKDSRQWKRAVAVFAAADSYSPGQAMASLRFAFGPQTVEIGGFSLLNYHRSVTVEGLVAQAAAANPLGNVPVHVNLRGLKQRMIGLGGDFTQARYGSSTPFDSVARYNLDHLRVAHSRVGLPLNFWTPEKGVYKDEGPAHAAFLCMQELARRRIPMVISVWEGPAWLLPGRPEQSGRTLAPERYGDCIEAVGKFLVTARDKYGAVPDAFSFNEADYGVNFRFTSAQIAEFIRQAGPRFRQLGLKTKFLVGDTGGGAAFPSYVRPMLADKAIAPYLGPLAFHCWDSLDVSEAAYRDIAAVGRESGKPILCTEAGHDAGLWEKPNPWPTWENALRTAMAYVKTLRLTGACVMDYWCYDNDYPLVSQDGKPYPVWRVVKQMEDALPAGCRIANAESGADELMVLASAGPGSARFSVLLVNTVGPGTITLTGLPPNAQVNATESTAEAQLKPLPASRTDSAGRLAIRIPARAVLTVRGKS